MTKRITCRYGKNGHFGICACDGCREADAKAAEEAEAHRRIESALKTLTRERRMAVLKAVAVLLEISA